jgi:hypothetical protein
MIEPFLAIAMFSAPTIMLCVFVVSAAETSSFLLQALTATIAEKESRRAARFLEVLRFILIIFVSSVRLLWWNAGGLLPGCLLLRRLRLLTALL